MLDLWWGVLLICSGWGSLWLINTKVDPTKAVWKCKGCGNKYDPFTKDEEMGWGAFVCDCGHQWHNGKSKWGMHQRPLLLL